MAYQITETFDHYNTAHFLSLAVFEAVSGSCVISSAYARFPAIGSFPNQGLFIPGGGFARKNLKSNQATLIAFASFGAISLPGSGYTPLIAFYDNGTVQCSLALTATGALQFLRGTFTVPIGPQSAAGLIGVSAVPNHGIEVQVTFSSTGGTVECWLDGSIVIAFTTGLNTINTVNAYANQAQLGGTGSPMCTDYFRVWDSTGSFQNAPIGFDLRKLTKLPAGAGALTGWTANGAAANWQCVDEASPDGDTTYVSSAGVNSDSYAMGTSSLAGVPSQVVVKSYVRKDDGATRTLQIGVRSGTSNGLGSAYTMGSTYVWIDGCISTDPATGSAPTAAAADAFQHLKTEAS